MNYWIKSDFIPHLYLLHHTKYIDDGSGNILCFKSPTLCDVFYQNGKAYGNAVCNHIMFHTRKRVLHIGNEDIPISSPLFKEYALKYKFKAPDDILI